MHVGHSFIAFISISCILQSITGKSGETFNLSLTEVQNIVSQKLEVAQNQNNATALEEAAEAANDAASDDGRRSEREPLRALGS